jgi:hypothetical protein
MPNDTNNILKYEFYLKYINNKFNDCKINNLDIDEVTFNWNSYKCNKCNNNGCIYFRLNDDNTLGWIDYYLCISCCMSINI